MKAKAATFESPEYGTLNAIFTDGGPWFFGKSIANALRMRDSMYRKSLKTVKDESKKRAAELIECDDPAMKQWIFLDEKGADCLIRDSEDKPRAMLFRDWMWSQTHPGENPPVFEEETAIAAPREIDPAEEALFIDNPILKFTNEAFGEVRVVEIEGEPWFVGRDVAGILGYGGKNKDSKALANAIADHVDEEDKKRCPYWVFESHQNGDHSENGHRDLMVINESGLYSLILRSKLPTARDFKRWVTSEVLPSIRKHGVYATDAILDRTIADPDYAIRLFTEIKEERERNKRLSEENANLTKANDILAEKSMIWDDRAVLNALVRAYCIRAHSGDFARGWRAFYKAVQYELGINLKHRKSSKQGGGLINAIKKSEFPEVVKLAVAMCQHVNLDPGKIINDVNAERCGA